MSRAERLDRIQRRFGEFAEEYAALPLYGVLAREVARDDETAALLLDAGPGQARPVLWFAALHDLVLRRPELPAARWYASVVGREHVATGDPWPDARATVLDHRDDLARLMATHSTQTNEVNRSVYLAVGLALAASDEDVPAATVAPFTPIALVELGASAGLLLGLDRYDIRLDSDTGSAQLGRPGSPVICSGRDRSTRTVTDLVVPPIEGRAGVDLHPVHLDDVDAVRWLQACLWPDVPGRVERFTAARDLLLPDPPRVIAGDMVDAMPSAVEWARAGAVADVHVVVFSSWALTYVARDRRRDLETAMQELSRDVRRLSWLTAEPPGCAPGVTPPPSAPLGGGGTVLGLRRWRSGVELPTVTLGTCHPHGEWLDLHLG